MEKFEDLRVFYAEQSNGFIDAFDDDDCCCCTGGFSK